MRQAPSIKLHEDAGVAKVLVKLRCRCLLVQPLGAVGPQTPREFSLLSEEMTPGGMLPSSLQMVAGLIKQN